jgi:hypothetical protein
VAAHLGRATGRKALTRVLTWDDGSFDFQAQVDPGIVRGTPRMLEAVLLDTMRIVDESRRPGAPQFAPETTVHTGSPASALTSEESGKLEASIADLAAVGIRVQELMELIPEPDFEIAQALARLAEQGVVVLSG